MKQIKKYLNNERGLTLIELLAVVVILGIIAAIAIPSIGGLIDNTKKDAHMANAQQMISSSKTAVSSNSELIPTATEPKYFTLGYLIDEGYLDAMKDPDGSVVYPATATNKDALATDPGTGKSYVKVEMVGKTVKYSVELVGSKKKTDGLVEEKDLKRSKIVEVK